MSYRLDLARATYVNASDEEIRANEQSARGRDLPDASTLPRPAVPRLAVVGSGPSILHRRHALRSWKGAVWAVNTAAPWCERNGINCWLFSIDATVTLSADDAKHIRRAILSARCQPALFDGLRAFIAIFDLPADRLGPGSAAAACVVGTQLAGFTDITFFGCEGSFLTGGDTDKLVLVECAGERFLTSPAYIATTMAIALTIRKHPAHVRERSGGFLSALVREFDYSLVGVSPAIAAAETPPELVANYIAFLEQRKAS